MSVPFAEPKYTGLAITRPSAFSNFDTVSFTRSSKTHLPITKHLPQPVQPRIALFPTVTISVSISASSKIFFISFSAMAVFPFRFGLPLIINTFITYSTCSFLIIRHCAGQLQTLLPSSKACCSSIGNCTSRCLILCSSTACTKYLVELLV